MSVAGTLGTRGAAGEEVSWSATYVGVATRTTKDLRSTAGLCNVHGVSYGPVYSGAGICEGVAARAATDTIGGTVFLTRTFVPWTGVLTDGGTVMRVETEAVDGSPASCVLRLTGGTGRASAGTWVIDGDCVLSDR